MKNTKILLVISLKTIMFFSCVDKKEDMDLIIYNAKIYTVDHNFSIREAFAVKDGKFVAVGKSSEILEKYDSQNKIDMQGNFIYPGFIDAHCHFYGYGLNLMNADLFGASSFDKVIQIIGDHHNSHPSEWITGRGWDQNIWDVKEFPHKSQLDEFFPDVPVLLIRVDGHAAIANSEALKRAGIDKNTLVPGGDLLKQNGELTGILIDNAISLVRYCVPEPSYEQKLNALQEAQQNCVNVGLTSLGDAGLDKDVIILIDSLQKAGDLKMRIYAMLNPKEENFEAFMYKGIYKTDFLNVRSVKLFADGALGSRGAKLLEEYSDDPGNYGILVETPDFLREVSAKAYKHGYQVNTHCIGDSAVRLMLNIYGDLLEEKNDKRWRIEHAQIVHPDDVELFGKYSVVPSVQAIHATSDMKWAISRLGNERIKTSYIFRDLLKQNGWLPNGSDFPVEPINPLYGFYAAVDRKDSKNYPENGFQMENALSREQALRAMTIWAAKANFEEKEKGSIEPGKFADFVVTGKDIMDVDMKEVLSLQILSTYIGGEKM